MISHRTTAAVIGGGPAGMIAAETLLERGVPVELFEAMPSTGRKFLRAGVGGLNLTHSEPFEDFLSRYGDAQEALKPFLEEFGPQQLRVWLKDLGFDTYVGSSGRVFPEIMKAPPILRAWRQRMVEAGLVIHPRHRWVGWGEDQRLHFEAPAREVVVSADAVILALGGGSWPHLGSDGSWIPRLRQKGVPVAPLKPSNCGFNVAWTEYFRQRYAGSLVKPVVLHYADPAGREYAQSGEVRITEYGIEGGPVYALSARLREHIAVQGNVVIKLDLTPDLSINQLKERLGRPRGSRTLSDHLRRTAGISGVKAGLLWEFISKEQIADPEQAASAIRRLSIPLVSPRPLEEAISSAGGVEFAAVDQNLMLHSMPGVFCAGEMLDWEAPTGGYLLTACFSTGRAAAIGAADWLRDQGLF